MLVLHHDKKINSYAVLTGRSVAKCCHVSDQKKRKEKM